METADAIDTTDAAPLEGDSTSPETRDYEAEARQLGWVPEDEFKGDKARWTDAETFVRRGEELMPLLKAQNKKLKADIDDLKRQMRKASEFFSRAEERGYQQALQDIERRHAEAVEMGDTAAATKAAKDMVALEKDFAKAAPDEVTDKPDLAAEQALFTDWAQSNDWYQIDDAKTRYADNVIAPALGPVADYPGGMKAWLAEIDKRVEAKFAAKPPARNAAPGQVRSAPAKGGKTFADLPPEAKAMCDKWVKQGLIKDRETYVKSYDWS